MKKMLILITCLFVLFVSQTASAELMWAGEDTDIFGDPNSFNWSWGFAEGGDTVSLTGSSVPASTNAHSGSSSILYSWTHTEDTSTWSTRSGINIASDGVGGDSIGSTMITHDVSGYDYLNFWVKGAAGGEVFQIKLASGAYDTGLPDQQSVEVSVLDYVTAITTEWQEVNIPLSGIDLNNLYDGTPGSVDLTNLTGVRFTVESGLPTANGTVYLDDVSFDVVPEPASMLMLATGLSGVFFLGKKKKR
jgi:hypothetical protein